MRHIICHYNNCIVDIITYMFYKYIHYYISIYICDDLYYDLYYDNH